MMAATHVLTFFLHLLCEVVQLLGIHHHDLQAAHLKSRLLTCIVHHD